MRPLSGWIFDVYAQGNDISVWLIDEGGVPHHLHDSVQPSLFMTGESSELRRVCKWLHTARLPVHLQRTERYDIFERCDREVLEVQSKIPALYPRIVRRIDNTFPTLDLYNADLSVAQFYFFQRHLFPLAHCHAVVTDTNHISEIATDDSPWALDYRVPPLRILSIQLEGNELNPNHGHRAPLEITYEDRTYTLNQDGPDLIEHLREHLERFDPDVIVSRWGDSFIFPQLLRIAQEHHLSLPLNRDPRCKPLTRPARSYFSYGRIIFKTMSHTLFGRWHIDVENAFLLDHGFEGAIEIARLTRLPLQQSVRVSTGTGISAMQVATAFRNGYLIPFHKREPEEFKSALELLIADKGGLTYQPIVGLHFDVAELDFASMYPAIMARYNVSPETIGCRCCPQSRVPEIGCTVCRRVRGLVPETLHPLIEKRLKYKHRIKQATSAEEKEKYRLRATAHKWLLVTCFGYLGYKNARFGKIEAHESVTAYGREMLLRAKEMAEERGFRVLHALTDSLWIQKRGTKESEYEALVREIERGTNLPIALEGIYKWVAFLPSRVDARNAVPNRYFGAMQDGELKIRGIELRRRDTPQFIEDGQNELLAVLAGAGTRSEISATLPRLFEIISSHVDRLRAGQVSPQDLVLTYHLSRDPHEYRTDTLNAIVARELAGRGITLQPGESIRYVITDYGAQAPADRARAIEFLDGSWGYDVERYTDLLLRAAETIVTPLGVNKQMLQGWLAKELPAPSPQQLTAPSAPYLGPLFETLHRIRAPVRHS